MIEAAWVRLTGWPVIGRDADRCCDLVVRAGVLLVAEAVAVTRWSCWRQSRRHGEALAVVLWQSRPSC